MTDICANVTRATEADLCVHVGTVHVDESTAFVDDLTHALHGIFEDAMCGGVGDHERAEIVDVLIGFFLQIGDVDVAAFVT